MSIGSKVKTGHQRTKGIGLGEILKYTTHVKGRLIEHNILYFFGDLYKI